MMTELEKQINLVVEARKDNAYYNEAIRELKVVWEDYNKVILEEAAKQKEELTASEKALRELAVTTFVETGEKTVAPGIGIRVKQVLSYEPKEAMDWAVKHELALKLDSSAFEKIAKTSDLPFVIFTEEPTATIATELQKVE